MAKLLDQHKVPHDALLVEHPISSVGSRSRKRADIVIKPPGGRALMVIECKDPSTPLHDGVWEQAHGYAETLNCDYIALTNGDEIECFHRVSGEWRSLSGFPSFEQMRRQVGLQYKPARSREFPPLTRTQLADHDWLQRHDSQVFEDWGYSVIGEDTPPELWTPVYALYSGLFHQPDAAPHLPHEAGGFRVMEHLGLHHSWYGNYGGGMFGGLYSTFRVNDIHGDDQLYKVSFAANGRMVNHPSFGNRRGTSGIRVAIDDFDQTPHISLELSLDNSLVPTRGGYELIHDGKITVGRLGAVKRDTLLSYVRERAPDLVGANGVRLGWFGAKKALRFSDIAELIFNILRYADLRDQFRFHYKELRAKE